MQTKQELTDMAGNPLVRENHWISPSIMMRKHPIDVFEILGQLIALDWIVLGTGFDLALHTKIRTVDGVAEIAGVPCNNSLVRENNWLSSPWAFPRHRTRASIWSNCLRAQHKYCFGLDHLWNRLCLSEISILYWRPNRPEAWTSLIKFLIVPFVLINHWFKKNMVWNV